jgi:hypothetical protein
MTNPSFPSGTAAIQYSAVCVARDEESALQVNGELMRENSAVGRKYR